MCGIETNVRSRIKVGGYDGEKASLSWLWLLYGYYSEGQDYGN
jgi:hypothetical protein